MTCRSVRAEVFSTVHMLKDSLPWRFSMHVDTNWKMTFGWQALPAPPAAYKEPVSCDIIDLEGRQDSPSHDPGSVDIVATFAISQNMKELRWVGNGGPGAVVDNLLHVIGLWCQNGLRLTEPVPFYSKPAPVPDALHGSDSSPGKAPDENLLIRPCINTLTLLYVPWDVNQPITEEDVIAKFGREALRYACRSYLEEAYIPQYENFVSLRCQLDRIARSGLLWGYTRKMKLAIEGRGETEVENSAGDGDTLDERSDDCEEKYAWEIQPVKEEERKATAIQWSAYGWVPGTYEK